MRRKRPPMPLIRGQQKFWEQKMGFKPPQYQVEQPTPNLINPTPDYLQDMQSKGGN